MSPTRLRQSYRVRSNSEQLERFEGLETESQGQNLVLTVLYVPSLLDKRRSAVEQTRHISDSHDQILEGVRPLQAEAGQRRARRCAPPTGGTPIGPYSRTMPRALRWSQGWGQFLMSEVPLHLALGRWWTPT